ncbi:hypothetical protein N0V85_005206 [Neurospora sp. IMI 360204]|nr:hypothetical protein N0V85_005206 [Neurospora sp. IMI 360204]
MPRYKQTARWAGEDSGATPRWQPSQRASFESDTEEKTKEDKHKDEKPKEEKPSFANHQKHKTLSNLRFSLEVLQIVGLAAFCLWVLRCLAVLESRIASAEAGLERLGTDSSGNDGHFFLHFPLEVLHIAASATFCVWVLRRLADLESRITAEAA